MRVVRVLVNGVALAPGGGLTFLLNQSAALRDLRDFEFEYYVAPRCATALAAVVGDTRLHVPFRSAPSIVRRLAWEQLVLPRIVDEGRYDILYTPSAFAVVRCPVPQLVLNHNPNHHASIGELGVSPAYLRARLERAVAQVTGRRADAVVYLSNAFAEAAHRVSLPAATAVIHSGVSLDWPPAEPTESILTCDTCNASGYALAIHNWYRHKNLPWLIKTWAGRSDPSPKHLVLVGAPIARGQRRAIRRLMRDPGVRRSVHLIERAERGQITSLYGGARLYLSAATLEAFPLTPLEAMSFGLPVVLSDIPAHREVGGLASQYFRLDSVEEFWSAVMRAPSSRQSPNVSAMNVRRFSWAIHAEELRLVLLGLHA